MSGSTKGHHLNKLGRACISNAAYQISRSTAIGFLKRFLEVFTIYGHGGHLGHVNQSLWTNVCSPNQWRLHMYNLVSIGPVISEEIICKCWRRRQCQCRHRWPTTTADHCLSYKLPRSLWLWRAKNVLYKLISITYDMS